MITVAQYRRFAEQCRDIAKRAKIELDRIALEMQATAWERIADQREAALKKGETPPPP